MNMYAEDEILNSLKKEFYKIPSYNSTKSKKVCKENADCCAVIADRCEELDLMKEAGDWREMEEAYRDWAKEAEEP